MSGVWTTRCSNGFRLDNVILKLEGLPRTFFLSVVFYFNVKYVLNENFLQCIVY